jgi:uncharacterized membrane protein (UPF0127 family)
MVLMKIPNKIDVSYNKKKYSISDFRVCSSISSKTRGLMFRAKEYRKPLLFVWAKEGRYPIHSFFCRDFLAVWGLYEGGEVRIIEDKIVRPYRFSVVPKEKFNFLLEIPIKYF